ncbi:MAG TPA: acyloxyacyl hydrolase [Candidatus Angelobacter sp.]|nr:acyloxyacyl hydrolase [Candidatus Angelobacter sp.]
MRSSLVRNLHLHFAIAFLALCVVLAPAAARAQSPPAQDSGDRLPLGHEFEAWSGFGGDPIGSPKITLGNRVWTAGLRYGWILTDAHGPGFLRGRFEYAVDALPVVMVFQPGGRAYGFGFDPWIMKWNLEPHHRISPYIELGGGALISTREIPMGENHFNFTPTGALGLNILRGKYHWSVDFRYFHISDAQITPFNPGTDTFGIRVGWGTYSGH